ncbi:MAG: carbon starvation protein A [Clostridium sp.]|uniref:carbon starvation CstA family protein n=1 Tax=Clostridium sp. DSM 8431 TaxID=1761781 RepID=UPI0008F1D949|nr:carbon starvation CstA family protein [Clostridium sp. DSM 8431]MCR4944237.1 carbon starvation protein A [Clostridium sp.]SFU68702.1 carbon starvation protein [Clostridium sp. DSM 8431]
MNGLVMVLLAIVVLGAAYLVYGRWLANNWGIDPKAKTPAYVYEDGEDYIPTPKSVVFSHQFSSIAGAGPVTGPIIAAMFGWGPVLAWILVGGIFFGAVHDFGALYASVKNDGKSIGCIIEQYIGKKGKKLFLLFSWIFSLLVIAAFADMVSTTFCGFAADGSKQVPNAAAASISMLFIVVAMLFGLFIKYKKPSQGLEAVIGIILLFGMLALGIACPIFATKTTWTAVVFVYLFCAAIMPMWLLMQPRDYLSTFLLLAMVVGAVLGVLVAQPSMNLNAFNGFEVNGKMLFPTLFVTIACGAVSGFHSLVSSGTSSKQVQNEKDMLGIGYGAMVVESLIGVIALVAVGSAATGGKLPEGTPFSIFAAAIAGFLGKIGISEHIATCFMTMCVSALALTSLDSVGRIGRMSFQEFFMDDEKEMTSFTKLMTNKYFSTIITLGLGLVLSLGGYNNVWALFGSANQLLSALVLIALAVFLKTTGRKGFMLYVPMFVMLSVTFTALVQAILNIVKKIFVTGGFVFLTDGLQLILAVLLMSLGFMVAKSCFKKLFGKDEAISKAA